MQHASEQVVAVPGAPDFAPGEQRGNRAHVRKHALVVEEIMLEGDRELPTTLRRAAAAAVITNPWAGRQVEDLSMEVQALVPGIARSLVDRLLDCLGGGDSVQAFGKGALVGLDGETEHGAALIHTPHLGELYRTAVSGTSVIAFSERRAAAGASLVIPMWHKTEATTRSHYQAMEIRVPDAPRQDEIVVVLAASTGPRPFARIGDRRTDPPKDGNEYEAA